LKILTNTGCPFYQLRGELLLNKHQAAAAALPSRQDLSLALSRKPKPVFLKRSKSPAAGGKSWELKATTGLARVWQQQGKGKAARQMLADIYSWFTEGFETPDLIEAKSS